MPQNDFCHSCTQSRDCKEVYSRLGETAGPSVAYRVIVAFLIPIIVFILTLTACEKFLTPAVKIEKLRIAAGFLCALAAAFLTILLTKRINSKLDEKR